MAAETARAVEEAVRATEQACAETLKQIVDNLTREHALQLSKLSSGSPRSFDGEAQAKRVLESALVTLQDASSVSNDMTTALEELSIKGVRCAALRWFFNPDFAICGFENAATLTAVFVLACVSRTRT